MGKFFRQTKQIIHRAPPAHFPRRVIIWRSPTDERFATQLCTHLQPKIRRGYINLWDASQIRLGVSLQEERAQAIASADVAVVLASADLIASDSFACEDLPQLLHRARSKKMHILLIHISACDLEGSGLENFRAINPPTNPLARLGNPEREEIWKSTKQVICQLAGIYA